MAAPPAGSRLQSMLQAAVQSVQWTYSLFWQFCPQQGILVWSEGYYNGAIKTRKTVQPMEVTAEEASLQRSQQLRELYDSLSAGETNQPARRPCAALSPEDLTESEWFYLMCVSFSFPPAVGLPGKAYTKRQHVWLCDANEVDSKTFSRAILAKSAGIQTVVCIPLLDGVVELGTTEKVEEDSGLVQHIKTFFSDSHHHNPPPPKPALSEHSTSSPAAMYAAVDLHLNPHQQQQDNNLEEDDGEEEEEEEEDDDDPDQSDSAETRRASRQAAENESQAAVSMAAAEPSELMQLEMSEDIRFGSPEDASNNLDSNFHTLTVNQSGMADQQLRAESFRGAESSRRCLVSLHQEPLGSSTTLQQLPPGTPSLEELSEEATHYSLTVSTILQNQTAQARWADSYTMAYSDQTAFAAWSNRAEHHVPATPADAPSQWLLKYILFTVPFLHSKYRDDHSPKSRDGDGRFRKGSAPQDELSANHVLAERRRREKLNERFIILRSLVPFVTKMDKASILGDTIEYVKQLRKKIQDLETKNKQIEPEQRSRPAASSKSGLSSASGERGRSAAVEKRKMRIVEGSGGEAKPRTVETEVETTVEVSIIESDALLEMQCAHREGLLLDVMQLLRDLRIETTAVQSSLSNGVFVAEVRAKVKENVNGKKPSIMEVKRAIKQIIP